MTTKPNMTTKRIALVVFIIVVAGAITGALLPSLSTTRPGGGPSVWVYVALTGVWTWALFACIGAWHEWAARFTLFVLGFVMIDAGGFLAYTAWQSIDWAPKLLIPALGALLLVICGLSLVYNSLVNPTHQSNRDD